MAGGLRNATALCADVRDAAAVAAAFDALGTCPDLVVNNAGIVRFGSLVEQSVEDFRATVDVNLVGTHTVTREAAIRMLARGAGHVVSITSIGGITPAPGSGAYAATKAAVAQLMRHFALECGPVRFNAVAPGFIDAGMSAPIYADPNVRARRARGVPLGRLGTAQDVAGAVLYLDSDAGAYVNGHELVVDGGVTPSVLAQLPRS